MPGPITNVLLAEQKAFRERVLSELFLTRPETRLLFPAKQEDAHQELVFALSFILDNELNEDLVVTFARDHRAFGLTPEIAQTGLDIIRKCIREFCTDLPYSEVHVADQKLSKLSKLLVSTLSEIPPPGWGKVVEVQRRSRRITVIRLECPNPIQYLPGQYLAVSSSLARGYWPHLAPALPSSDAGFIEFHLSETPELSRLAVSQPGDEWYFGPGHGNLHLSGENDALLIARGTGLAALRAILLDQIMRGTTNRIHLFFGAEFPGELYDLQGLWHIAANTPWLSVTPVVEKPADEWWVGATEHSQAPRGLHLQQVGTLAASVSSWGTWADREVLISGAPEWAQQTRAQLIEAGTPADNIQVLAL
ncbi:hypothetical protein WG915_03785 [Corynebacterium sp. H128]|uniref:hypothetical protein n=1 Tax=Corynebacterium sp. H128 TaxID=3133427 RepID=UPI0030B3F2A1